MADFDLTFDDHNNHSHSGGGPHHNHNHNHLSNFDDDIMMMAVTTGNDSFNHH